ncbi:protein of unknown function [endosymbiont DhMRE of Dentiscutata heterogama]|nr:protein of unknown function [endosymbiont DhMRE of Dentiscutata heterogama]
MIIGSKHPSLLTELFLRELETNSLSHMGVFKKYLLFCGFHIIEYLLYIILH